MFNGNWVDLVILAILLFFVLESFRVGVWIILADFVSFLLSLLVSLRGYQFMASVLRSNFSLSHSVSNALGFLLTAVITEAILGFVFSRILLRLPKKWWEHPFSKYAAIVPALGEGLVLIAFILTLIIGFPVSPTIKKDISESKIGGLIIKETTGIEQRLGEIFGEVIQDSLTYLTVKPDSQQSVPITVDSFELAVDTKSELAMFEMVNAERRKVGVRELSWEPSLLPPARAHAEDMWKRKYFSHVSPEGEDVGDRLQKHQVRYTLAGENLALAPTLETAHTGLMNSEGHRANILEPRFSKIGIGVIDNGYYGKMFVQVFLD